MRISPPNFNPSSNDDLLVAHIAGLELEVDRRRKQGQFLRQETEDAVGRIQAFLHENPSPDEMRADISSTLGEFMSVLQNLRETPEYDPTCDRVAVIALRPLIEDVGRAKRRFVIR